MRAAFTEKQREEAITHDGYLVVDFINPDELEEVRQAVKELGFGVAHENKLRISTTHESVEKKIEIFEKLSPLFQRVADNILYNYKLIRIALFDKLPGGKENSFHSHPNLVDESKYRSFTTWAPLTATTVEMGTLHVIKGSHKFANHFRSYNDYFLPYKGVSRKLIGKYGTPLLLKAGQAVIFDDRLIQQIPPSKSTMIWSAIKLDFIPQEAKLTIYYRTNEKELLSYTIDEKSFREAALTIKKSDDLQLIGKLNQPNVSYSNKQIISMMKEVNPGAAKPDRNLFERLLNL